MLFDVLVYINVCRLQLLYVYYFMIYFIDLRERDIYNKKDGNNIIG